MASELSPLERRVMQQIAVWENEGVYPERVWLDEVINVEGVDAAVQALVDRGVLVETDVFVTTPAVAEHGSIEAARQAVGQ
jgi:(2Fe-2S) ferredoxin